MPIASSHEYGSDYIDRFYLFFISPFIVSSFLGGYKQDIWGISLDHFSVLLALAGTLLSLKYFYRVNHEIRFLVVFFLTLSIAFCLTIFFADEKLTTLIKTVKHLGYWAILLGFFSFCRQTKYPFPFLINIFIFSFFISVAFILVSWWLLGVGDWGRVTIPVFQSGSFGYFPSGYDSSSDPNVLAFFLYLGVLIVLAFKNHSFVFLSFIPAAIFAALLTQSRSSLLAFILALIYVLSCAFLINLLKPNHFKYSVFRVFTLTAISTLLITLLLSNTNIVGAIFDRFSNIDSISNLDRLVRIERVIDEISKANVTSLMFGHGFSLNDTLLDPHNQYLSLLYHYGFFGCAVLFVFLATLFIFVFKRHGIGLVSFFVTSLIIYFSIHSMFYWQSRSFYLSIMIVFVAINFTYTPRTYSKMPLYS